MGARHGEVLPSGFRRIRLLWLLSLPGAERTSKKAHGLFSLALYLHRSDVQLVQGTTKHVLPDTARHAVGETNTAGTGNVSCGNDLANDFRHGAGMKSYLSLELC